MHSKLEEYRRHAANRFDQAIAGDADASNESYDRLLDAFLALARDGRRSDLFALYNDANSSVQCSAAAHTLEVDEAKALAKLAELENSDTTIVGLEAEYTIKEWKAGNLKFLPT